MYGHMGDEKAIQIGHTFLNPSFFELLGNFFHSHDQCYLFFA